MATASAAAPEETEKPNFESSWPVRTNSWVCASTPGVTLTSTFGRSGAGGDDSSRPPRRATSSKESTTIRPTPSERAAGQLLARLVVAVQHQVVGGDAGRERDVELSARRHVEVHALLVGQAGHLPAQEGLGGVGDTLPPGRDRLAAGVAQMILVVDEEGRAELLGQLEEVDAADVEVPVLVHERAARQEVALQRCGGDVVVRRHGDAGYGSPRGLNARPDRCRCAGTTIVPCSRVAWALPAPVAQRIEHRPPEPVAQVRVLPGAPTGRCR